MIWPLLSVDSVPIRMSAYRTCAARDARKCCTALGSVSLTHGSTVIESGVKKPLHDVAVRQINFVLLVLRRLTSHLVDGYPEPVSEDDRRFMKNMVFCDVMRNRALIERIQQQYMTAHPTETYPLVVEMDYQFVPRRFAVASSDAYRASEGLENLPELVEQAREGLCALVHTMVPAGDPTVEGVDSPVRLFISVHWPST